MLWNYIKKLFGRDNDTIHALGIPRSSQWPTIRKKHLEKEPRCQVCGGKKKLTVHHVEPFHLALAKELDEDNLITLCEENNCHYIFGHFCSWRSYNPNVREDVKEWRKKIEGRP